MHLTLSKDNKKEIQLSSIDVFNIKLKNNNYNDKFLITNSLIGLQNLGNTCYMNSSL